MEITAEVREFARNNPQPFVPSDVEGLEPVRPELVKGRGQDDAACTTSAEEVAEGMAEISKRFHDEGGEPYVPAAE